MSSACFYWDDFTEGISILVLDHHWYEKVYVDRMIIYYNVFNYTEVYDCVIANNFFDSPTSLNSY